jgi:hypothetical protein
LFYFFVTFFFSLAHRSQGSDHRHRLGHISSLIALTTEAVSTSLFSCGSQLGRMVQVPFNTFFQFFFLRLLAGLYSSESCCRVVAEGKQSYLAVVTIMTSSSQSSGCRDKAVSTAWKNTQSLEHRMNPDLAHLSSTRSSSMCIPHAIPLTTTASDGWRVFIVGTFIRSIPAWRERKTRSRSVVCLFVILVIEHLLACMYVASVIYQFTIHASKYGFPTRKVFVSFFFSPGW